MGHVEGLEDWGLEAFNFTKKRVFLVVFVFVGFWVCLWWVLGFVLF
jgi:hypothetical protein